MENIEQIIRNNSDEFITLVMEFVKEKTKRVATSKKGRLPKTICHFSVLGKNYSNNIFSKNYVKFLEDISNIHGYELFKKNMGNYANKDINDYPTSKIEKSSIIKLKNGTLVSLYSSTEIKMKHIQNICDCLNVPITFNVEQ